MSQAVLQAERANGGDARLETLASAVPNGVFLVRADALVWANERFIEMSGRGSAGALLGTRPASLFDDAGSGRPLAVDGRAIECALVRPDGDPRTVICRIASLADDDLVAWVVEDVTHVRMLERELLRMSQDLHRANREVAALRERAHREHDEREELLTVVSHELRTPVTIIAGYNKLLLSEQVGALSDEQRHFLEESSKGCQRLDAFIGNLLEANRVSDDGEVLEVAHAPVGPVIEGVVGLLRPLLDSADLKLNLCLSPEVGRARFDRTRLERILTNLIGNAIKFSPQGGAIEVSTRAVSDPTREPGFRRRVEIRIADEGPGVAEADRERIFDAYVQVGEESRAGGLGLGLAICKRLVEAHGGTLCVEDRNGPGSEFVFDLPVEDPIHAATPAASVE